MKLDAKTIILLTGVGLSSLVLLNSHSESLKNYPHRKTANYRPERDVIIPTKLDATQYLRKEYL